MTSKASKAEKVKEILRLMLALSLIRSGWKVGAMPLTSSETRMTMTIEQRHSPMYLHPRSKHLLQESLNADVDFLCESNIMDYS